MKLYEKKIALLVAADVLERALDFGDVRREARNTIHPPLGASEMDHVESVIVEMVKVFRKRAYGMKG